MNHVFLQYNLSYRKTAQGFLAVAFRSKDSNHQRWTFSHHSKPSAVQEHTFSAESRTNCLSHLKLGYFVQCIG